jgi:hypothetical protein
MINAVYLFFAVVVTFTITYLMLRYLDKCPHQWTEIESGNLLRGNDRSIGGYKAYQCEHCKKFKTETWRIDRV